MGGTQHNIDIEHLAREKLMLSATHYGYGMVLGDIHPFDHHVSPYANDNSRSPQRNMNLHDSFNEQP
jgi:hypothetical protein